MHPMFERKRFFIRVFYKGIRYFYYSYYGSNDNIDGMINGYNVVDTVMSSIRATHGIIR
jgi:hypothetical protein